MPSICSFCEALMGMASDTAPTSWSMVSWGIYMTKSAWADASRRPLRSAARLPRTKVSAILTPSNLSRRSSCTFFIRRMQPKNSTAQRTIKAACERKVLPDMPASSFRARQETETSPNRSPALAASFQRRVLSNLPFMTYKDTQKNSYICRLFCNSE